MARRQSRKRAAPEPLNQAAPPPAEPLWPRWLAFALAAVAIACVAAKTAGWNGPYYWKWNYIDLPIAPFLGLGAVAWGGILGAQSLFATRRRLALALLAAIQLFLVFSFIGLSRDSFDTVRRRIENPDTTSYYTIALRIDDAGAFLRGFHNRLPGMVGHSRTHPPGPTLYFYFWKELLGPERAALWSGLLLAPLAALAIPLLFGLTRRVSGDEQAAFAATALWTPLPAIIIMLGSLDTVYPALTLAMLILWLRACWEGDRKAAVALGAVAFLALFFAHNFLVLGAPFALLAAAPLLWGEDRAALAKRAVLAGGLGLGVAAALFGALWAVTGYQPVSALLRSIELQEEIAVLLARPYRLTVFWDIYDYFLASGWLPFGLLVCFGVAWRRFPANARAFAAASLLALLVIDFSGLLRTEAARVWLFLQPLLIPVAGMALARWSPGWRAAAYGAVIVALAVIRARMVFL